MEDNSKKVLKEQKKIFFSSCFLVIFLTVVFGYWLFVDKSQQVIPVRRNVDLPGDKVNPQDIWMNRMETDQKIAKERMKYLETILLDSKKKEETEEEVKLGLKREILKLRQELKGVSEENRLEMAKFVSEEKQQRVTDFPKERLNLKQEPNVVFEEKRSNSNKRVSENEDVFLNDAFENKSSTKPIKLPLREIIMPEAGMTISHVDRAIPSGTSVKALLVSSVDSICGVYAAADPVPVKLRLIDDAHLPKDVRAKLKGAVLIASAYGNISSERVYMRLERLTQVNHKGEFVETVVTGYVSGEDGKYGVRGSVVDKSGKMMSNAAYSGFLSGLSRVLQSAVSRNGYSDNKQIMNAEFGSSLLKEGTVGGTSNALDMLSDYYIRRAEQVQPVIQVNAGRIVDITFTHEASLGEINTKDKIKKIRNENKLVGRE